MWKGSKPVINAWLQNYGSKRTIMRNETIIAKETEKKKKNNNK